MVLKSNCDVLVTVLILLLTINEYESFVNKLYEIILKILEYSCKLNVSVSCQKRMFEI